MRHRKMDTRSALRYIKQREYSIWSIFWAPQWRASGCQGDPRSIQIMALSNNLIHSPNVNLNLPQLIPSIVRGGNDKSKTSPVSLTLWLTRSLLSPRSCCWTGEEWLRSITLFNLIDASSWHLKSTLSATFRKILGRPNPYLLTLALLMCYQYPPPNSHLQSSLPLWNREVITVISK